MYPISGLGQFLAIFTFICGILIIALPVAIIGTKF
jgi:hypothetical protein